MNPIRKISLVSLTAVFIFSSCIKSVNKEINQRGEEAEIKTSDSKTYTCETLAVDANSLIVRGQTKIYKVNLSEIEYIYFRDFSAASERRTALILPIVGDIILTVMWAGGSGGTGAIFLFPLFHGALSLTAFALEPYKVRFTPPLSENQLKKFKRYCRYPEGLTEAQWKELLGMYGQEDYLKIQ